MLLWLNHEMIIPGECTVFSCKNTEAWANCCSPSLRKQHASAFVWAHITSQQLPLLNVTAFLTVPHKGPSVIELLSLSLSRRSRWPQAVETRGPSGAGCSRGPEHAEACCQHPADVMKLKTGALNMCLDEGVEQKKPSPLGLITTNLYL